MREIHRCNATRHFNNSRYTAWGHNRFVAWPGERGTKSGYITKTVDFSTLKHKRRPAREGGGEGRRGALRES